MFRVCEGEEAGFPRGVPGMSNMLAYFPFIGASAQPSEKDMQEFLEINDLTERSKVAEAGGSVSEPQLKLQLQVSHRLNLQKIFVGP